MTPPLAKLRPFGRVQDLDIEFADENRPSLVTTLLARCGETSDVDSWWDQTVGTRIAALLRLLVLTEGDGRALISSLRCTGPQCGQRFDVALPIDVLTNSAQGDDIGAQEPIIVPLTDGRSAALRRPTGRDLLNWHHASHTSRREAVSAMLDTLVVEGAIGPDDEPAVAEAMATHDPLVAFAVSCACPDCGAESERPVDLEAAALARLRVRQRSLLREVHVLASKYGWTESEVLAIAPLRRARYLELIEERP